MALVRYFSELRVYQQANAPHTPIPPYSETDEA
jgi:hypothetical protein